MHDKNIVTPRIQSSGHLATFVTVAEESTPLLSNMAGGGICSVTLAAEFLSCHLMYPEVTEAGTKWDLQDVSGCCRFRS